MAFKDGFFACLRSQGPEVDGVIAVSAGEGLAALVAESQRQDRPIFSAQNGSCFGLIHVPQAHSAVVAAGSQGYAAGGESHAMDIFLVTPKHGAFQDLVPGQGPEANAFVGPGGGKGLAVGGNGQAVDRPGVLVDGRHLFASSFIERPDADGGIGPGGGQVLTVRRDR